MRFGFLSLMIFGLCPEFSILTNCGGGWFVWGRGGGFDNKSKVSGFL